MSEFLESIVLLCKILLDVTLDSFGPTGNNVIICNRDKVYTTSNGLEILKALRQRITQPLAHYIIKVLENNQDEIGDGSKIFLKMVSFSFQEIETFIAKWSKNVQQSRIHSSCLSKAFHEVKEKVLKTQIYNLLLEKSTQTDASNDNNIKMDMKRILQTFFMNKFGTLNTKILVNIITELIFQNKKISKKNLTDTLFDMKRNIPCVSIIGMSINQSFIAEGLWIEKELVSINMKKTLQSVNSVVYTQTNIEPRFFLNDNPNKETSYQNVINTPSINGLIIKLLKDSNVQCFISTEMINDELCHLLVQNGMIGLQLISKDDLDSICNKSGVIPWTNLTKKPKNKHICRANKISEVKIKSKTFIQIAFNETNSSFQLILCSPTETLYRQYYSMIKRSIQLLFIWTTPSIGEKSMLSVSAGFVSEILIHNFLRKWSVSVVTNSNGDIQWENNLMYISAVFKILSDCCYSVFMMYVKKVISNPFHLNQILSLSKEIEIKPFVVSVEGKLELSKITNGDQYSIIEPLELKYRNFLNMVELITQLTRIESSHF